MTYEHDAPVHSAVYRPDGKRVLTASRDCTIREFDRETGSKLRVITGHADIVWSAVYSIDGGRILSASEDRTIREFTLIEKALPPLGRSPKKKGSSSRIDPMQQLLGKIHGVLPEQNVKEHDDGADTVEELEEWKEEKVKELRDGVISAVYSPDAQSPNQILTVSANKLGTQSHGSMIESDLWWEIELHLSDRQQRLQVPHH